MIPLLLLFPLAVAGGLVLIAIVRRKHRQRRHVTARTDDHDKWTLILQAWTDDPPRDGGNPVPGCGDG